MPQQNRYAQGPGGPPRGLPSRPKEGPRARSQGPPSHPSLTQAGAPPARRPRDLRGRYPQPGSPPRRPRPSRRPSLDLREAARLDGEAKDQQRRILLISVGIMLGAALLLLLMIWLFGEREDRVQLQRQTQASSRRLPTTQMSTLLPSTTALQVHIPSDPARTAAPLSTDPYQNQPSWQAPSATDAPVELSTLPASTTALLYAPPATTPLPVAGGGQPQATPAPVPAAPPVNLPAAEAQELPLPAPPNQAFSVSLSPPSFLQTSQGFVYMGANADGSYSLRELDGVYEKIYTDPIGQNALLKAADGSLSLFKEGQLHVLNLAPQYILDDSMNDEGFAYLDQGQLSYYDSDTGDTQVLATGVQMATGSRQKDFLYLHEDGTVRLLRSDGQVYDLLASQGLSTPYIRSQSQSGGLGVFDDEQNIYVFSTEDPSGSDQTILSRISKEGMGEIFHFYAADEREVLVFQEGTRHIFRRKFSGDLEQISLTEDLSIHAKILPAGEGGDRYDSLILHDMGKLWLSTPFMLRTDGEEGFTATQLAEGVSFATTAGNALYFQDQAGALYVMDLFGEGQTAIISDGPVSAVMPFLDGTGVYYLSQNTLWRRRHGQSAERVADQVQQFWINKDGSRAYYLTVHGGLMRLKGSELTELLPANSGATEATVAVNSFMKEGLNQWLTPAPFIYAEAGVLHVEP